MGALFAPTRFSLVRIWLETWLQTEILTKEFWGWGSGSKSDLQQHPRLAMVLYNLQCTYLDVMDISDFFLFSLAQGQGEREERKAGAGGITSYLKTGRARVPRSKGGGAGTGAGRCLRGVGGWCKHFLFDITGIL